MANRQEQVVFGDWRDYICDAVDEDGCTPVHSDELLATPPVLLQSHAGQQHAPGTRRMPMRRWRLPQRYHTPESLVLLRRRVVREATRPAWWRETEVLLQKQRCGKHRRHRDAGLQDPREDPSSARRWSNPGTCGGEEPPNKNTADTVLIPEGRTANLDMDVNIKFWVIEGYRIWDMAKSITMEAKCIIVNGGQLLIGSEQQPYRGQGTILFHTHWHSFKLPLVGTKGLFETRGLVEMFGEPLERTWEELNTTAMNGSQLIKLKQGVDWAPGSLSLWPPIG